MFDDFFPAEPAPEPEVSRPAPEPEPLPWPPAPSKQPAAASVALARPRQRRAGQSAKAGLGVIAAAAGAGLGAVLGGPLGAAAGLVGVGTMRNLYRSQAIGSSDATEQSDGARSLALGIVGLGIAGYLGYKIWARKEGD